MPQMAPMSWMSMYMYFIFMMMMFIMMIYFNKMMKKISINELKNMNNEKLWKW
uniref:ATP synthase F0 subunit 8 n=1 Tax=Bacillus atticus TaxID=36825 RepID=E2DHX8_9NEOP|nr:ATP synthase F0 subunit 8 [Bacillus atticus]